MQMICHVTPTDYATWKAEFDATSEARSAAGLSLLQIWRDADGGAKVTLLFEVNDRARAQDWLNTETGLGRTTTAQFLKTA